MTTMSEQDRQKARENLWEKIKDVKFGMLTTHGPDSHILRSRPMTNQQVAFDGELWFFASEESHACVDIRQHPSVNVSYANPDDQLYISVAGKADLVRDRAKAEELWNPLYKAWFPGGLDDPKLVLIRIRVDEAEYWDSASGAMTQLFSFFKTLFGGKPEASLTEHEKVTNP